VDGEAMGAAGAQETALAAMRTAMRARTGPS
jgi:hypothetical protein